MPVHARKNLFGSLEPESHRLSPKELGVLAKRLAAAKNPKEAARLRRHLTRGFYSGRS